MKTTDHASRSEPAYELANLSEVQARTLVDALDFFSRIQIGQFEEVLSMARMGSIPHRDEVNLSARIAEIEEAEPLLREVKRLLTGHSPNASFGILSDKTPESAKVAYEIQRAIRHRLAWDRQPEGGIGVDFDDPDSLRSTGQPLAVLKRAQPNEAARLEELPKDCLVGRFGEQWRIVVPQDDGTLRVLAESAQLETAIQQAHNALDGKARRGFGL